MLRTSRIIWSDNGTLQDLSQSLLNLHSGSEVIPFVAAQDYLFIGSELPFNHRYFEIEVANANASQVSIALWNGTNWEPCVDVLDETSVSGAALAQSGRISWVPDRLKSGWSWDNTDEMTGSGLESLRIDDLYWIRLSLSADLDLTTELSLVGHKFCDEEQLVAEYPDLARATLKTAWAAGKTTWNEQILVASRRIIEALQQKKVLETSDQIMEWSIYSPACIHKTAEIIFKAFGDDYENQLVRAIQDYANAIDVRAHRVDKNKDGVLGPREKKHTSEYLTR